jgi:hypothetical protein
MAVCAWCKRPFSAIRDSHRFCSVTCHDRYHVDQRRKAMSAYLERQRIERSHIFFAPDIRDATRISDEQPLKRSVG